MLTLTDLFCGAGGSSTGAIQVPGVTARAASNHWQLAVDTHNTNHPDADHICADLSQIDPRYFPTTDILWASPECTNHSIARGKKRAQDGMGPDLFGQGLPEEAAQRSRATMWDVPRFAETHRYQAVIVENVVDAANWTPFKAWLLSMDSLGYDHQVVYLNSMHAWALGPAAPQSRDRMYVVFWRKGSGKPDLEHMQRPPAVCPEHGRVAAMQSFKNPDRRWGRYRAQYVYRCPNVGCRNRIVEPDWVPAASVIDWTDLGTRIGDRARPLAEKTLRRIQAGIDRYWGQAQLVPVEGREGKTAQPVSGPVRTQTTRNETGLLVPAGGTWNETAYPTTEPARTRTTRETEGVVFPLVVNNVSGADESRSSTVREPLPTMVAGGLHASMLTPPSFIAELRGGSSDARAVTDPLATVTASGNHHGLVMRHNSGGAEMLTPTEEPVRTLTTAGHQSLISPGARIEVDDCSFRMLTPHEIQQAMAFPGEYQLLGNKREKVRMAGNAVTPPAARDLVGAVAASLN